MVGTLIAKPARDALGVPACAITAVSDSCAPERRNQRLTVRAYVRPSNRKRGGAPVRRRVRESVMDGVSANTACQ